MATYADYIQEALRAGGILAEGQDASAEQGADGLIVFNDMMSEWESRGITVGYPYPSSTTATILLDAGVRETVKSNLALRLCGHYGLAPPGIVSAMALSGYSRLLAKAVVGNQIASTTAAPMGSGYYESDILNGP